MAEKVGLGLPQPRALPGRSGLLQLEGAGSLGLRPTGGNSKQGAGCQSSHSQFPASLLSEEGEQGRASGAGAQLPRDGPKGVLTHCSTWREAHGHHRGDNVQVQP